MIVAATHRDLDTPTGPMRTHVYAPANSERYPGLLLYPEIFQQTGPIIRLATQFASHGFVVMAPEIYHEHEPLGTVLTYDDVGRDKGNAYKHKTKLSTFDNDARVVIDALNQHPQCNGRIGTVGFCIGGHLAFRAALQKEILAGCCFYPTDLHSGTLGEGKNADTLARAKEIGGDVVMIWVVRIRTSPARGARRFTTRCAMPARDSAGTSSMPSMPSCATKAHVMTRRRREFA